MMVFGLWPLVLGFGYLAFNLAYAARHPEPNET